MKHYQNGIINSFEETDYGNLDGNTPINFFQHDGCSLKTDKLIIPSNEECPTGELTVFYEAHPGPNHLLFTKCYGWAKCFWRSFKRGNDWWFDN